MSSYYYMRWKEDEALGVAYAPEGTELFVLPEKGRAESWSTLRFTLRYGGYSDYPANDMGCRLCSGKLREIIDRTRSEDDEIQWLDAVVADGKEDERQYHILHFPTGYDILDRDKTLFAEDDVVVRAVISAKLCMNHSVFTFDPDGSRIIVSEKVRKLIVSEKLLGINFGRVLISK